VSQECELNIFVLGRCPINMDLVVQRVLITINRSKVSDNKCMVTKKFCVRLHIQRIIESCYIFCIVQFLMLVDLCNELVQ
jgi:hypothetical protein